MAQVGAPVYQVGGLASGLDSATLIKQLVSIEGQPIALLKTQQTAMQTQVSSIGTLQSLLTTLQTTSDSLGNTGSLSTTASSSSAAFSAVTGAGSTAGRFGIEVLGTASAARQISTGAFVNGTSQVKGGSLVINSNGQSQTVKITDGMELGDVASAINAAGLPVSATVLSTGKTAYLSITNINTGYTPANADSSALQITETSTGSTGAALGFAVNHTATNSSFNVDGLTFTRQSNAVTDVIPGTTLKLTAQSTAGAEDLVLTTDPVGSQANVQKFVDAFNALSTFLSSQTAAPAGSDTTSNLSGDSNVRGLQNTLQGLTSQSIFSSGSVRSLADIGIKTATDGTLSIDSTAFATALAGNPSGVSGLFSTASAGLTATVDALAKQYNDPVSGAFISDLAGLNTNIKSITTQSVDMQARVDAYQQLLTSEFTAMENIIAQLQGTANQLNALFNSGTSSSSSSNGKLA